MPKKKRKTTKKTLAQTIHQRNRRKTPFRNVQKDGVTYSFLDEWLMCREQARLSYVEGWSKQGLAVPLDFGLAFHDCLEWIAKGRSPKTVHNKVIAPYLERKLAAKNKLRPDEVVKLTELLRSVEVVFQEYAYYYSDTDEDFQYIYQEKSFKVDHTLPSGKTIPFSGIVIAVGNQANFSPPPGGIWSCLKSLIRSAVSSKVFLRASLSKVIVVFEV